MGEEGVFAREQQKGQRNNPVGIKKDGKRAVFV
jgi:hypothetical protein